MLVVRSNLKNVQRSKINFDFQGVPIIMSCPHFLYSEEKFTLDIDGVKPKYEDHATLLYVEPMTGILMKANKRIQFNTQLYQDPRIT